MNCKVTAYEGFG